MDDDTVSLDNLQRQIVHDTAHIGAAKVASAKETIARLNPHARVETWEERIDAGNALDRIARYDIVADGSDNFATRYLVSDACYLARKPLVFAAVGPFEGYITTLKPHEKTADGTPFPATLLFPEAPPPGTVANCAEVGCGRGGGRAGHVAGDRGAERNPGPRRQPGGATGALRCALLPLQRDQDRLGPANPLSGKSPTIRDLSIHAVQAAPPCVQREGQYRTR